MLREIFRLATIACGLSEMIVLSFSVSEQPPSLKLPDGRLTILHEALLFSSTEIPNNRTFFKYVIWFSLTGAKVRDVLGPTRILRGIYGEPGLKSLTVTVPER